MKKARISITIDQALFDRFNETHNRSGLINYLLKNYFQPELLDTEGERKG